MSAVLPYLGAAQSQWKTKVTSEGRNVHLPELHPHNSFPFLQRCRMQSIISPSHFATRVVHGRNGLQQRAAVVEGSSSSENLHRLF
jgi:hypothetical protein